MSYGIAASQRTGLNGGGGNSAYATAVLQDSPLLFLKFDEQVGDTVMADSSGNGHDGTYVNSPYLHEFSIIPGSSGRSARFENSTGNSEPTQRQHPLWQLDGFYSDYSHICLFRISGQLSAHG